MFSTEKVNEWFEMYTDKFRSAGKLPQMLELKKHHSKRVAAICEAMAAAMEWEEPFDNRLAYTIGLLHDVGRYPQYEQYGTFLDSASIDHGELSAEIIQKEFNPENLSENIKQIIITAVRYHNKKDLPTGMALIKYRWASLIRDADKIDIYRMVQNRMDNGTIFDMLPRHKRVEGLSPELVEEIRLDGKGSYSKAKSLQDYRLIQLTWGCDLNFRISALTLIEEGIFDRICSDLKPYGIDDLINTLMERISAI